MSQPDKIFRNALEHFRKPAPASAWDRIESGLERKPQKSIWLKIAAGFLLLVAVSFMLWSHSDNDPSTVVTQNDTIQKELKITSPSNIPLTIPQSTETHRLMVEAKPKNNVNPGAANTFSKVQKSLPDIAVTSEKNAVEEEQWIAADPEDSIVGSEPTPMEESNLVLANPNMARTSKRTNLIYTSEEMNAKFIKQKSIAKATPEKKTTSALKKVIDVAYDLKHVDSIYGDLRQIKNDLLTFNFPEKKKDPTK